MPASASLHAIPAGQPAGDRVRGWSLAALRSIYPDLVLETWTAPSGTEIVDLIRVPEGMRRKGFGTMIYRAWERTLAPGTRIELFAVDLDASAFWRTLGFDGEDNSKMGKTVGGTESEARAA